VLPVSDIAERLLKQGENQSKVKNLSRCSANLATVDAGIFTSKYDLAVEFLRHDSNQKL
jgi:hypothetical protein